MTAKATKKAPGGGLRTPLTPCYAGQEEGGRKAESPILGRRAGKAPGPGKGRSNRGRAVLTEKQRTILSACFQHNPKPDALLKVGQAFVRAPSETGNAFFISSTLFKAACYTNRHLCRQTAPVSLSNTKQLHSCNWTLCYGPSQELVP